MGHAIDRILVIGNYGRDVLKQFADTVALRCPRMHHTLLMIVSTANCDSGTVFCSRHENDDCRPGNAASSGLTRHAACEIDPTRKKASPPSRAAPTAETIRRRPGHRWKTADRVLAGRDGDSQEVTVDPPHRLWLAVHFGLPAGVKAIGDDQAIACPRCNDQFATRPGALIVTAPCPAAQHRDQRRLDQGRGLDGDVLQVPAWRRASPRPATPVETGATGIRGTSSTA